MLLMLRYVRTIFINAICEWASKFCSAPTTDILPVKAKIINLKEAQKECKSIIATGTTLKITAYLVDNLLILAIK